MRRPGLWLRWSGRDLRGRWALVVAIALTIAIGTGLFSGLGSLESWRKASLDASFQVLRAHDLEIGLSEGGYVRAGALERLVRSLPAARDVEAVEERLVVPTQVEVPRPGGEPLLVPGELVGSELGPGGPAIDGVAPDEGRGLRAADAGRPVAVLDAGFGEYHGLAPSGAMQIADGARLRYVGLGRSPEYFRVIRPGGGEFGGTEASFAVVYTSLETAQGAVPGPPRVNDAVLRLPPGAGAGAIRRQLEAAFARRGIGAEVTGLGAEPSHRVLYEDAEGDQRIFNIFALLVLGGAALASFNLASRIVEAQRREIGIGMALGVEPRKLAIRPLLLGAEIALLGVALGLVVGLAINDLFRGMLEDLFVPVPEIRAPFEPQVFVRGALLGLAVPILATAIPVWRGVRVAPIEAIRVGFRSARSGGLAALGKRLRLPGPSLAQMPLRNVLRAPRRSLMTALGIGAVVTVVVALLGFLDSFDATVGRSAAEIEGSTPDRITVTLDDYHRRDSPVVRGVRAAPGVGEADPRLVVSGALGSGSQRFDASIGLLDFRSRVWRPTISEGRAPAPGQPGIVIAEKAASDLGVEVGDRVRLTHPRRTRAGRLAEVSSSVEVVGLHPDPFRIFAYMDSSRARSLGLAGEANQVAVAPAPGVSAAEVERTLFGMPGVAAAERATATTDFVRERLDEFVGVLQVTEAFALLLALLIAFNTTSISADERARENATMLAFGVPVRRTLALAIAESLITGIAGTLIGLAGGLLVVRWAVESTLPEVVPDLGLTVTVAGGSVAIAALVGVVAVGLAPLLTARRVRRMDVPSTLRVVE